MTFAKLNSGTRDMDLKLVMGDLTMTAVDYVTTDEISLEIEDSYGDSHEPDIDEEALLILYDIIGC